MNYETITSSSQLDELCNQLAAAPVVGFDTEFVSEDTFFSKLCLIQVAAADVLAIVDPLAVRDVSSFWRVLADRRGPTIVHAGREEVNFALAAVGRAPAQLFDTQLAAGFVSDAYPSSYGGLIRRYLHQTPAKGETRTDWRRRPLTRDQIQYALDDVRHLGPLRDRLLGELARLDRVAWLQEEMQTWLNELDDARSRLRWRRVSGVTGLSDRSLAIVRELWMWRNEEAQRRDIPAKRVLRDDLIVELAKRKSADPQKVRAIRALPRHIVKNYIPPIAECIQRGLDVPESELPTTERSEMPRQLDVLGQFLTPALSSICRQTHIAASLVGTASDVRELIAYRLGFADAHKQPPPALAVGWRAKVVGDVIDELLAGRRSIRIADPHSDHPLSFDIVGKK